MLRELPFCEPIPVVAEGSEEEHDGLRLTRDVELRATLESLGRAHPGRVLQAKELPEHPRNTGRRTLSKLESPECEAIVAALEQSGGTAL